VLRQKAIELGFSYALEGGADGVAIPWSGRGSFETVLAMSAGTPVWIKPTTLQEASAELGEVLDMGGTGLWLDQRLFASQDPLKLLEGYRTQIHVPEPAG
jgi:DhnA family fructose-bisphosphate aldolase class Ia